MNIVEERWIKAPPARVRCPSTGMKRGQLLNLAKSSKVKAAYIREAGAKRGSWLINLRSVFEYLEKEAAKTARDASNGLP